MVVDQLVDDLVVVHQVVSVFFVLPSFPTFLPEEAVYCMGRCKEEVHRGAAMVFLMVAVAVVVAVANVVLSARR